MTAATEEKQRGETVANISVSTDHRPVVPGNATFSGSVQVGAVTATVQPPDGSVSATPLPDFGAVSTTLPFEKGQG